MRTYHTWFFILLFPVLCEANRIDSLLTDKQVEALADSYFEEKTDFDFGETLLQDSDSSFIRISDSLHVMKWDKADFDMNGRTDILINGFYMANAFSFVVMDFDTTFKARYLSKGMDPAPIFPTISRNANNKASLIILHKAQTNLLINECRLLSVDTLVYEFKYFVEYNPHPTDHHIEQIEFSTDYCMGACPVFNISINSKGYTTYNAIDYNDQKGKYKCSLDTATLNKITSMLNYFDFPSLDSLYSVNWTDDQSAYLTIIYDNGKIKKIKDYGEIGTSGLIILYAQFFAMRGNQNWVQQ